MSVHDSVSAPRTETNYTSSQETAYRGTQKTFEWGFWQDDARLVPSSPGNPSVSPRVQIYTPEGEIYLTAAPPAVRSGSSPGSWLYDFQIPVDAKISSIGKPWEFAAEIILSNGRRETYRTTFGVHDPSTVKTSNTDYFYSVLAGRGVRLMYRSVTRLYALNLCIPEGNSDSRYLLEKAALGGGPYDLKESVSDGVYVYYIDIPYSRQTGFTRCNLREGTWTALWEIQETPSSFLETVFQQIRVLPLSVVTFVPDIRMVVDKLQKRSQSVQSVSDTLVYAGISRGLQLVNSTFPSTSWTYDTVPEMLQVYVVIGAAYFIYCTQLGLAVDMSFSYSGQQTVLDQDQSGGIEGLLSRYQDHLRTELAAVKMDVLRHMRPVGVVATRPARSRNMFNRVFKVSGGSSMNVINFLNGLGLI